MSIEDEIRAKKEKMQADIRKAEEAKREAERVQAALNSAGMNHYSPVLIVPATELQTVISEAMPSMRFYSPKIVRTITMTDGQRTFARHTKTGQNSERADMYSFDVTLYSSGTGKGSYTYNMWVFKNGAISFNKNGTSNMTWAEIRSNGITAATVRSKIIDTIAQQSIQNEPSRSQSTSKSSSSGGCYIATAVYGSYDCPEVWVLRRYRDNRLQKNTLGKLFVKVYYAVSPTLVKWFGKKAWFTSLWRAFLDNKVSSLKRDGYSDERYND